MAFAGHSGIRAWNRGAGNNKGKEENQNSAAPLPCIAFPTLVTPFTAVAAAVRCPCRDNAPGQTNEVMLEIPAKLMIGRRACEEHPVLGPVYIRCSAIFNHDEDMALALFLMYEHLQGSSSFWKPYIDILPDPGTICEWSMAELAELQDP